MFYQLTCDVFARKIIAQDSAVSGTSPGVPTDYVGQRCVDALADQGGFSSVIRSSVSPRAQSTNDRQRLSEMSVLMIYQLPLIFPCLQRTTEMATGQPGPRLSLCNTSGIEIAA